MSPPPDVPPVMADIARAAGVHQTTVSRALRNDPRLSRATAARIQTLARDLGYRPNPMVSALIALRRSRHPPRNPVSLAFITLRKANTPDQFTTGAHLEGAQAEAERQGYRVDLFRLNSSGMSEQRLDAILAARNIPGAIIASLPQAHGNFQLDWGRLCTVVIEYTFTTPALDRVVHDSYDGMRRILAECRRRGLRRVGLVLTEGGDERTERLNGAAFWVEQKADSFFAPIPPLIVPSWNARAFERWRRRYRLAAVVTSNALIPDLEAWAVRSGVRIGRDLSLINVNADPAGTIGGIYQEPLAIGAIAARMLIEKIGRNDRGVPARRYTMLTQGRWVEGLSLRQRVTA